MTTAFKCDICGEYFEYKPTYTVKKVSTDNWFYADGSKVIRGNWDICDDCGDELESCLDKLAKEHVSLEGDPKRRGRRKEE